ncbi:hypothetical protein AVEN_129720-1 [Araneus ventricosus]|uniref:Uncharacterized protein n=1 Tax=Araneus ventricosus TaxID=182803 RepID=A0A4Y2DKL6_ARAVE|nr:hypothetical protein AVEN_129720-1 [Araneus ventricosus]
MEESCFLQLRHQILTVTIMRRKEPLSVWGRNKHLPVGLNCLSTSLFEQQPFLIRCRKKGERRAELGLCWKVIRKPMDWLTVIIRFGNDNAFLLFF